MIDFSIRFVFMDGWTSEPKVVTETDMYEALWTALEAGPKLPHPFAEQCPQGGRPSHAEVTWTRPEEEKGKRCGRDQGTNIMTPCGRMRRHRWFKIHWKDNLTLDVLQDLGWRQ